VASVNSRIVITWKRYVFLERKGIKVNRKLDVIKILLLVTFCLFLRADVVSAAISTEELQKIEKAVPTKAVTRPRKPRKMLVFSRAKGLVHTSIPYATKALELMGEKTGAFQIVVSDDMSIFNSESLKSFDAICFNNSNRMDFTEPAMCMSLLEFVRSGRGVVGIHAITTNFSSKKPVGGIDWPEAAEMIGGIFAGHHWRSGQGEWAVRNDDPINPLNAAFGGKGFKVADEIYMYTDFQKDDVRVLLSLDFSDPKTASVKREQTYVPISWIRKWGKGRVFYCSLGHDNHIFWNPAVLKHYLAGIQFALGDLPVDTTPTIELRSKRLGKASGTVGSSTTRGCIRKSSEQVEIREDWGSLMWLASKQIGNAKGLTLGRVTIKAGHSNPRHRHPKCEEVLYLLKGRLEHTVADEAFVMSAGDVISIAPGVFHDATCIGDEDADMIVVYSEGTRGFELEPSESAAVLEETSLASGP
jgi:type 1 glutamine amidotransferase/quercetin dioxygenase-like cupin family protein